MAPQIPPMPANNGSLTGKSNTSRNSTRTVVLNDGYGTIKQSSLNESAFTNFIENLLQASVLPQNLESRKTLTLA